MSSQYFITEKSSDTGKKFQVLADRMQEVHAAQVAIANELGFEKWKHGNWSFFGGFSCIIFDQIPDLKIWSRANGGYYPKKNSRQGKDIARKLETCPKITVMEANLCVGWNEKMRHIGFAQDNEVYFGFTVYLGKNLPRIGFKIPSDCEEVTITKYRETFNYQPGDQV